MRLSAPDPDQQDPDEPKQEHKWRDGSGRPPDPAPDPPDDDDDRHRDDAAERRLWHAPSRRSWASPATAVDESPAWSSSVASWTSSATSWPPLGSGPAAGPRLSAAVGSWVHRGPEGTGGPQGLAEQGNRRGREDPQVTVKRRRREDSLVDPIGHPTTRGRSCSTSSHSEPRAVKLVCATRRTRE